MNFLSKQMRNKIIVQALVATSVFGMGIGYNLVFTNPINVNALYSSNLSTGNITQFASGGNFNVFMKSDGTVWAMGENWNGQLGIGSTSAGQFSPIKVPITNVKTIICGMNHTIFIKNDGTVWGCGRNDYGQLGIGNAVTNQLTPVQLPITDVQTVSCGYHHTIFIKNDGTAWSTGDNDRGQLGIGSVTNQYSPVQISSNVKEAVCGGFSTILIKNDDTTWGTGYNNVGQFGLGDTNNRYVLTQTPITNVSSLVSGASGSIYIKNDGTVWGVGYNNKGQLGIGNQIDQYLPVQLLITDVKSVYAGTYGTYFIKNDGTIWGCGGNSKGELGIGNYTQQNSIIQLPITGVNSIGSGQNFNIYFKADGSIWASGDNNAGQFGLSNNLGSTTGLSNPINLTAYWLSVETATNAVVKAEGSKSQVDVDSARTLVNALLSGNDKNGLTSRLNTVQYSINLTNATAKVTTAESTKLQADVDIAQTAINLLPAGTDKTSLQARLDLVKAYIAVVKAESTKTQTDVNSATTLVNALPSSTTKIDFTNRLAIIQTYINNITDASNKVATAENNKTQADVDSAQIAINLIPTGDINKSSLQSRLDVVKAYIDYQAQLTTATDAVVTAESSKLQADVNSATMLVNALFDSTDKTNLTNRLNVLQTYINNITDATTKIGTAESSKTQSDVDLAQIAINLLPDGDTNRTILQSRLDVVKAYIVYQSQLANTTKAVVLAENSKLQADIDSAFVLVNALSSSDKTILEARLTTVQTYINNVTDATSKVSTAENTETQTDVDLVQSAINLLPIGDTNRIALQSRVDVIKAYIVYQAQLVTVTNTVIKAESSKLQEDLDSAKNLVNELPDGLDKTSLTQRLDIVQAEINKVKQDAIDIQNLKNAQDAVTKAESAKTQSDVDSAKMLINALPDSNDKTGLIQKLGIIQSAINQVKQDAIDAQNIKDAQNMVTKAGTTLSPTDVTNAQLTINKLPSGADKIALQSELDKIKQQIADKQAQDKLLQVTVLVTTAENTKSAYDITKAQSAVSTLPSGTDKNTLQLRLDTLKVQIVKETQIKSDLKDATLKVQIAEVSVNLSSVKYYIVNAQMAIDKLSDSSGKTALQDRLNKIATQIAINVNKDLTMQAKPLVQLAELYKTSKYINQAWIVINKMTDCQAKTDYMNRLNSIK